MFYLIGGTPRTGKTSLAKILSKELNIPWISTDTIESVVSNYVSEKELPLLFPKSIIRKETKQSNDIMYETYSSTEIVNAYLNQAKTLEKALKIFLGSEDQCNHSYIIEGYHITPSLIDKLKNDFEIKSIFLGRDNKEDIRKSITIDTDSNNWVIGKTKNPETFDKITNMIAVFSEQIKQEVQSHNQQYFSIDGDFMKKLNEATTYLK